MPVMSLAGTPRICASVAGSIDDAFQSGPGYNVAVMDRPHAFVPSHTPHASTLPLTQHCPDGGSELEQH